MEDGFAAGHTAQIAYATAVAAATAIRPGSSARTVAALRRGRSMNTSSTLPRSRAGPVAVTRLYGHNRGL